ncbi:MAG: DUF3887 domain-containing protein, partial [Actinobacteria bacterium]|nr:DUF3887 domain-containing protein [Actinomycetota bacterium]
MAVPRGTPLHSIGTARAPMRTGRPDEPPGQEWMAGGPMFTRHRHAPSLLALILAAGLAACGGDTEPEEPEVTAVVVLDPELSDLTTEFIGQLVAGDFAAAVANFDDTMADALPAADLAATWQQVTDQFGEYQAEITRRQEVVDVYEAVIVTAQFEQ